MRWHRITEIESAVKAPEFLEPSMENRLNACSLYSAFCILQYCKPDPILFGFDRARWKGLWRVKIQEYLIAVVQNIEVLLRYGSYLKGSPSAMKEQIKRAVTTGIRSFSELKGLMKPKMEQTRLFGFISLGYHSLKLKFLNLPFGQQPVKM